MRTRRGSCPRHITFRKIQLRLTTAGRLKEIVAFVVDQNERRKVFDFDRFLDSQRTVVRTAGDCLAGLEDEPSLHQHPFFQPSKMSTANQKRLAYLIRHKLYDLPDNMRPPCHRDKQHSYRSVYGRMRWDKPAQTITTGFGIMGQGRFVHPTRSRTITPHEAARLQGFPDFFDFSSAWNNCTSRNDRKRSSTSTNGGDSSRVAFARRSLIWT